MADPSDGNIAPGVNKQTRRFAPVTRGRGRGRGARPSTVAVKVEEVEVNESSSATATPPKSIGTMRPETSDEGRLPSINDGQKTRGGAAKMKFKPTVPTKRNKKEVSASAIDDALNTRHGGERGRGRGRGAGRGRGRGRGNGLVYIDESTASGIFSLGPSAVQRGRPTYGSGGGFATYGGDVPSRAEGDSTHSDMVQMFTETYDKDTPVTFKHTSYIEGDVDPVTLSQKIGKIPWMRVKPKKEGSKKKEEDKTDKADEVAVKPEPTEETSDMETDDKKPETKEKSPEPEEQEQEEEEEPTEPILMNADSPAQNILALDKDERAVCVAEEELLYFQLPTIVPKFEVVKSDTGNNTTTDVDMKEEPVEGGDVNETDDKQKELPNSAQKATLEEAMSTLKLEEMPEGQVGKLVVYKSGKMRMQFGSVLLDVIQGMHSSFLENVMVVDHESDDSKKVIELGHIVEKFVCIPNMDALLSEEEKALV